MMEETLKELQSRYNKATLTKKELAKELNLSQVTLDRRIKEAIGIPNYIRSGRGQKSTYLFPITEVARYLSQTVKNF